MLLSSRNAFGVVLRLVVAANAAPFVIHFNDVKGRIGVQAHRGGLGMRSEESLWAFAYAMEVGVDTLDMDTLFTKDGIPVIWHDKSAMDLTLDSTSQISPLPRSKPRNAETSSKAIPIVALLDPTTIIPIKNGTFLWLGGLAFDKDFGGDWVAAAASIGSTVLSPWHGKGESVNTPGYIPFTTKNVVDRAHAANMKVIPWTVDSEVTINKLIDDGVDAVISDYHERVMWVAKQRGLSAGRARRPSKPECLARAAF